MFLSLTKYLLTSRTRFNRFLSWEKCLRENGPQRAIKMRIFQISYGVQFDVVYAFRETSLLPEFRTALLVFIYSFTFFLWNV